MVRWRGQREFPILHRQTRNPPNIPGGLRSVADRLKLAILAVHCTESARLWSLGSLHVGVRDSASPTTSYPLAWNLKDLSSERHDCACSKACLAGNSS
jgi:hypothetical protein